MYDNESTPLVGHPSSKGITPNVIRVRLSSIMVDDQQKALDFYTRILGFQVKHDIPMGGPRWLTLTSPDDPNGVELVLEPLGFEPARAWQKALFDAGIPITALLAEDIHNEHRRMAALGVVFRQPPAPAGPVTLALFEDTCGNLVQLFQPQQ